MYLPKYRLKNFLIFEFEMFLFFMKLKLAVHNRYISKELIAYFASSTRHLTKQKMQKWF